ncbi:MAG: TlyA family RNA methyltransferase [Bacillota bacterium]
MPEKRRLDVTLVDRGLFDTRSAARGAIIRGDVLVEGRPEMRPGRRVDPGVALEVTAPAPVGRGALKLQRALEDLNLDLCDSTVLDVGASTGGFTETLLHAGVERVIAVDVGRGQLHPDLEGDPRVVNLEATDIRRLDLDRLGFEVDAATVDVSFISLEKVLPSVASLLREGGPVIALIKPQFEAGPADVGGGGIVRKPEIHRRVIEELLRVVADIGFVPEAVLASPVLDPDANLEFFLLAWNRCRPGDREALKPSEFSSIAERVVRGAREERQGWRRRWEKSSRDR